MKSATTWCNNNHPNLNINKTDLPLCSLWCWIIPGEVFLAEHCDVTVRYSFEYLERNVFILACYLFKIVQ